MLEQHVESPLIGLCVVTAATQTQPVQLMTGSNKKPTTANLTGAGAQAAFHNAAGQLVVVTNNSPGSVTIPLNSNGDPSIPSGADVTVVSNNPSVPSTSSSSSPTGWHASHSGCFAMNSCRDLQSIFQLWLVCFACHRESTYTTQRLFAKARTCCCTLTSSPSSLCCLALICTVTFCRL